MAQIGDLAIRLKYFWEFWPMIGSLKYRFECPDAEICELN